MSLHPALFVLNDNMDDTAGVKQATPPEPVALHRLFCKKVFMPVAGKMI
jgi:hypothetical protein